MKSLRFIITVPTFYIGGFSSHALKMSRSLRARGHWTCAFVVDPFGQLHEEFRTQFDRVVVVRRGLETRAGYLRKLRAAILGLEADVIINNAIPFVQATLPYLPQTMVKISVLHNITASEIQAGIANCSSLDWIVAVSQNVYEAAGGYALGSRLVMIPVGVEQILETRGKRSRQQALRFVYVGRLAPKQKNLQVLERVVTEVHHRGVPFSFSVVGDGEYRASLQKWAANQPFFELVKFMGVLTPRRISECLGESDVFLMTSIYEGTPHALLEAMAAGVVPVCSCIPGATDQLIEHRKTGFLCRTHEVDDYVSAISELAQDPVVWGKMSQNAQDFVRGRFSMDVVVDEYLELIARSRSAVAKEKMQSSSPKLGIAPELMPMCPTLLRQVRRLGGDVYRRWFHGVRPVDLSGMK